MPKDVQHAKIVPDYDAALEPARLPAWRTRKAKPEQIKQIAAAIKLAKRPIIYAGGGIISGDASDELRTLAKKTGIPVTMTVMGLGAFPSDDPLSLDMLGMHGSRVRQLRGRPGRPADRARRAVRRPRDRQGRRVLQARQDRPRRHRRRRSSTRTSRPTSPSCSDVKYALAELNKIVEPPDDISAWVAQCQTVEAGRAVPLQRGLPRHPAAARDPRAVEADARPRPGHHRRRRPAPDVGRPVLQVRPAADVPLQQRPGHDGLRPARRDGRASASSPTGS